MIYQNEYAGCLEVDFRLLRLCRRASARRDRCKRGKRAYLLGRFWISAGWSAEKSIFGFSDSVGELRLAELSL
ncbi:hypothetical protein [Paenibacillus andongensis]|uniref:hypothetical protein n=1 Tax=Paenibacillus andongensis TaxID=2975482 RepID=UPI0021BACC27|nr:hypothetical protein [Paenibacillus andongensis]